MGDWNRRIGREQGRAYDINETEWVRNSEDEMVNQEGIKLLELCEDYGLTILNERLKGDRERKLTYIGLRGSSVLDYIIF